MKSVINLIKTPQGYSLLEGDIEINKNTNKIVKEKNFSLPKSNHNVIKNSHNKILPSIHTSPIASLTTASISSFRLRPNGSTSTQFMKLRRRLCLSGSK